MGNGHVGPRLLVGSPSGLLDFVLPALRALRPCDPHNKFVFCFKHFWVVFVTDEDGEELGILVVGKYNIA